MSSLTTQQFKQLQSALLDAFRDRGKLEQLVYFSLDMKNLNEIVDHAGNLENDTWKLIIWAESYGKLSKLIKGALKENPDNLKLKTFCQEWKNLGEIPRETIRPRSKSPLKAQTSSPLTNLLAPPKSFDDGLGADPVSSADKLLYHKDDTGWIVYTETTKLWRGNSPRHSCDINGYDISCAAVTKPGYVVNWDIVSESKSVLNISLQYFYQNELKFKRVTLVCDPIYVRDIHENIAARAIVEVTPSLVGIIDTEHVLLEYSVLEYQLTSISSLPVIDFIEIGFRLWCNE